MNVCHELYNGALGIENFAMLSTGAIIENPKYLRVAETQLKVQQRKVSKKNLHVAQQRKGFFRKRSLDLIRVFDEIAVEDLNDSRDGQESPACKEHQ